ncbi:MAG: putative Ig domain-containing protein, partial [Proteobacteria bacterium]|nr:putative Ig domain-containing protein [Pseudomonadota bacterium]
LTKDAATTLVFTNNGGAPNADDATPVGCTASDNLPTGLAVGLSADTNSCAITGMPTTANATAVTVTVTATNASGSGNATVTLTVADAASLVAPALTDLVTRELTKDAAINLVFTNNGGAPNADDATPVGCTASNNLPTGLAVGLSADTNSCAITGSPATASATPVTVTVTATNASGNDNATVTLTVANPQTPLTAPALTNLGTRTLTTNTLADDIVFDNTGGAPNTTGVSTTGCAATGLPPALAAELTATLTTNGTSCALTGTPTTTTSDVTVTVTATNVNGSSMATVILTIVDGTSILTPPAQTPTLTAGTAIAANAPILIPTGSQTLAANSCAFVTTTGSGGSATTTNVSTLDGLSIATDTGTATGSAAPPAGCRITGTPAAAASPSIADRTYTITATGANGGSFTTTLTVSLRTNSDGPILPAERLTATATVGIDLMPPLTIANADVGADIASCAFLDADNNDEEVTTLKGLTVAVASAGRACQITGSPTTATVEALTVRARAAPTMVGAMDGVLSDATITITVTGVTAPVLPTPTNTAIDATIATAIAPITLTNTNSNNPAALVAGSCVLVSNTGDILDTLAGPGTGGDSSSGDGSGAKDGAGPGSRGGSGPRYTSNGLTLTTDVADNACTVTGTPTMLGDTVLRIRADKGTDTSNVITLTFTVERQDDMLTFNFETVTIIEGAVTKRFGDDSFSVPVIATSGE